LWLPLAVPESVELLNDALISLRDLATQHPGTVLAGVHRLVNCSLSNRPGADDLRKRVERCLLGHIWGRCEYVTVVGTNVADSHPSLVHSRKLSAISLSPDGKGLVTGDESSEIGLWDVQSGRLKATLESPLPIKCIRHHPRAPFVAIAAWKRVSVGDWQGALWIVDATTLTRLAEVCNDAFGKHGPNALCWSPDGHYLICGLIDSPEQYVIETKGWSVVESLKGRGTGTRSLGMSGDGSTILSGSSEGYLTKWRRERDGTFSDIEVSGRLGHPVSSIEFSSAGCKVAVAFGKVVRILDYGSGKWSWSGSDLKIGETVLDVRFGSRPEEPVAVISRDGLRSWMPDSGVCWFADCVVGRLTHLSSSLGGELLAVAESNGCIHIVERSALDSSNSTGRARETVVHQPVFRLCGCEELLAWWDPSGLIGLSELRSGRILWSEALGDKPSRIAMTREGTSVAAALDGGRIIVWDRTDKHPIEMVTSVGPTVNVLAFLDDGKYVLIGGYYVEIRDSRDGRVVSLFVDRNEGVLVNVKVCDERGVVFLSGSDSRIACWTAGDLVEAISDGNQPMVMHAQGMEEPGGLRCDKILEPCGWSVGLGEVFSTKGIATDLRTTASICEFDVDRDSKFIVALEQVRIEGVSLKAFQVVLTVWDRREGKCIGVISSKGGQPFTCVAFSPCGNWIAVGDVGGVVSLWRRSDISLVNRAHKPCGAVMMQSPVMGVSFSSDGENLFIASDSGNGTLSLSKYAWMNLYSCSCKTSIGE
jgi:WD40 repeat protein